MKKAIVTGANRGIGFELVKQLSESGVHVYALCRHKSDELDELDNVHIIESVDVRRLDSIHDALNQIDAESVDCLINNAGILKRMPLEPMNDDSVQTMQDHFETNAMGPLMLTSIFLPLLRNGSKVILMTSRMGSIEDNDSGSHYAYRMSKAALNAAGKSLSIDLKERGVSVGIFHPGWIQTGMTGFTGNDTPETSAGQLIDRINELNLENTGAFWHANGISLPW